MSTAALYQWSAENCPVNIFIELPLVDRLRAAATSLDNEVGGFLVGRLEANNTIVTDFELVESEHRRGAAYTLSRRDDERLLRRLTARGKRRQEIVGFFRSHMRPGLFLDTADYRTLCGHFDHPQQVALLIKPAEDQTATGGFFFWQDGDMDRKQCCLPFPMDSAKLQPAREFQGAETLDELPQRIAVASSPVPSEQRANWVLIGAIAAVAAVGGYLVGVSSENERRPGDFAIPVIAPPAPSHQAPRQETPRQEAPPAPQVAPPEIAHVQHGPRPHSPRANLMRHAVFENMVRNTPPPQPLPPVAEVPIASAFPHNPNPLPLPTATTPAAAASVSLEALEDGGFKQAIHRIPLLGSLGGAYHGGQDFRPPQVVRRTTPQVPAELARELTSEVPVDLKLKVDSRGRVASVELLSRGAAERFAQLAGDAAYAWQFVPARMKDRPVSSDVIAHFRFRPGL